mmetsp:Transcript_35403/g.87992  ORF Transcript_35403/g.87992 Transcript_35403/m.87992 type:complete len:296 (+) Transcript_35403:436-1323(+)
MHAQAGRHKGSSSREGEEYTQYGGRDTPGSDITCNSHAHTHTGRQNAAGTSQSICTHSCEEKKTHTQAGAVIPSLLQRPYVCLSACLFVCLCSWLQPIHPQVPRLSPLPNSTPYNQPIATSLSYGSRETDRQTDGHWGKASHQRYADHNHGLMWAVSSPPSMPCHAMHAPSSLQNMENHTAIHPRAPAGVSTLPSLHPAPVLVLYFLPKIRSMKPQQHDFFDVGRLAGGARATVVKAADRGMALDVKYGCVLTAHTGGAAGLAMYVGLVGEYVGTMTAAAIPYPIGLSVGGPAYV